MKHGTMKTLGVTALGAAFAATGASAASATEVTDTVSSAAEQTLSAPRGDGGGPQELIGGLPTETVTDAVGGGLPTGGLPLGGLLGGLPVG